MATGQTENFPVYPKHCRAARFAKKGCKKSSKSFSDLLLHIPLVGGALFSFRLIRQLQSEFEQAPDERLYHIVLHIGVDLPVYPGKALDITGIVL